MNNQTEDDQSKNRVETEQADDKTGKDNSQPEKDKSNGSSDKSPSNHRERNGPPTFDWVSERSACSLPKVFNELRLQVEDDVKTRNALRPNSAPYGFSVEQKGADFTVVLTGKDIRKSVTFSLVEHAILVRDDHGKQMFDVTLTFSDEGQCRFNVNGTDRELWQVRRMALEDLLFARN